MSGKSKIGFLVALLSILIFPAANADESSLHAIIGSYGNGKIVLMQMPKDCLIAITGHDKKNQPAGVAIYVPAQPNALFLIPDVNDANAAASSMYKDFKDNDSIAGTTRSTILIDNQTYPFTNAVDAKGKTTILIAQLKDDLSKHFKDENQFFSRLDNLNNNSGMTSVTFDLKGISAAMDGYKKLCQIRS